MAARLMGLLVAGFDASAVKEDEFNDWYDTEHFPQRMGLPGFETSLWFGLLAPADTPDAIRDRLAAAIGQAAKSEAVLKTFRAQGIEPLEGGPVAFTTYIAAETARWADVAVKAGLVKP